jgi:subtilisin family serine protease
MSVGSPGNLPYLLTVGALTDSWTENDRSDDYIPDFSSRGPTPMGHIKPDLVAPGGHIAGITRPGSGLADEFPEYFLGTGEFVMTGSSQAAAVMSGLAALILELEPTLNNDELKCLFVTSAEPAIEADGRLSYSPFVQGSGAANARRALTLGEKHCDQQNLDVKGDITGPDHYLGPAIFRNDQAPSLPDEAQLVAPPGPKEGPSPSRRWGASEHLRRLSQDAPPGPIDWQAVLRNEQTRIRALSDMRQ